jgi:hypothetical protein
MNSGADIFNFLKPKLTSIGISEDIINLFIIGDTIKDYSTIPFACVIVETSTDETHFTHYGSRKDTTTGNMENFTTIVEKAQDVYIAIYSHRNDIFTYRDNFYKSFTKNDQFTGTGNGAYRLVFLRDELYNQDTKSLGLAVAVIYMKFLFKLQNKQIVKPVSEINIEKNIEISY